MFRKVSIKDWRQFSEVDIDFHPNLTVLTGANGAGKTTILNLLATHFGWESQFVSSFLKDEESGYMEYSNSIHEIAEKLLRNFIKEKEENAVIQSNKIGEIQYKNEGIASISLPNKVTETYGVNISNRQNIRGIYISSHRPTFPYRKIKNIPTQVMNRNQIYQKYYEFTKTFVFDKYRNPEQMSATGLIKETIASLAMFGYGNKAVSSNMGAMSLFESYEEILRIVLPTTLGFQNIKVEIPEVILCTQSGDFPLDSVSGGISSIIDITWQLFMYAPSNEEFVAVIDEPENHLHPELQKSFLNNLIRAFPNVQFVVATHNPFMISAVKDSNVYVLNYSDSNKVSSLQLDHINRAGTSNAILREVLGVGSSMPFWAESILTDIVNKYSAFDLSKDSLDKLREEMTEIGLESYVPETIASIVEGKMHD